MENKKTVLVTGATGQQGGAVTRALLELGHEVRAMVRNPEADSAVALSQLGVDLVVGDMDDVASIAAAAAGVDGVWAVTSPFVNGVEHETVHGRNLVDGAVQAGVPHFVFSSVADADKNTGIPHFESKWQVEEYLAATDLNWTITAPVFFSDNVSAPWMSEGLANGFYGQAMPGDRDLQVIDVATIGAINARVLDGGEAFYGERIDMATDELTGEEAASALSHAFGHTVTFNQQPIEGVREAFGEDMALMYQWFDDVGYSADIDALKVRFPDVVWRSFSEWAGDTFATTEVA
jgi:uncharacterized protein YbjT (DUF2867 family)